jgi:hypothetical protein
VVFRRPTGTSGEGGEHESIVHHGGDDDVVGLFMYPPPTRCLSGCQGD